MHACCPLLHVCLLFDTLPCPSLILFLAALLQCQSSSSAPFLQATEGVTPLPKDYNPATWMLEVSGGGAKMHTEAAKADFGALYRASPLCAETKARATQIADEARKRSEPLALASRYAAPLPRQIAQVTKKLFIVYWRAPRPACCAAAVPQLRSSCCAIAAS
jgi:hypothetical protein